MRTRKKPHTPPKTIKDMADLFRLFPTNAALAEAIGVGVSGASEMKRRNNIPNEYWPKLMKAAEKMGRADVTLEKLLKLSALRRKNGNPLKRAKEAERAVA